MRTCACTSRCRGGKRGRASPLLDIWAAQGLLDVGGCLIPVDLLEHLVHAALLRHEDGTLAVGDGLEQLQRQAARAHPRRSPHLPWRQTWDSSSALSGPPM